MDIEILGSKKLAELREIAKSFRVENCEKMKKAELIQAIAEPALKQGKVDTVEEKSPAKSSSPETKDKTAKPKGRPAKRREEAIVSEQPVTPAVEPEVAVVEATVPLKETPVAAAPQRAGKEIAGRAERRSA